MDTSSCICSWDNSSPHLLPWLIFLPTQQYTFSNLLPPEAFLSLCFLSMASLFVLISLLLHCQMKVCLFFVDKHLSLDQTDWHLLLWDCIEQPGPRAVSLALQGRVAPIPRPLPWGPGDHTANLRCDLFLQAETFLCSGIISAHLYWS